MDQYNLGKKLIISSDGLDFLENLHDFNFLTQKIVETLDQRDIFLESKMSVPLDLKF